MAEARPPVILTIDDEKAIRSSFRNYLEDYDYEVLEAENGRIGLEIFEQKQPDLALVDLRMPEMDGLEVLERITARSPDTPIIVVSGTGVIGDAVEALRLGAWDYLLKPVEDMSVLRHAIEKALERVRLIRENREYQKHLETQVAERTKELAAANEDLNQVNNRLRALVETTRDLSECSHLKEFGARLLTEFGRHMHAKGGSLYLVEDSGLRLIHVLDPGHALEFIPFPLTINSVFQRVFSRIEPVLIQNLEQSPGCKSSGWSGYKDGSILAFPLPDETGNIIAVLSLHSKRIPPFIQQDKEIGTILASYSCKAMRAALAINALMESEEQFKTVINDMPVMLCRFNPDGVITFVNNYFCRYFGKNGHEVLGNLLMDFIPGTARESALSAHAGLTPEDSVIVYEQSVIKTDGEMRWQRWTERAIFDENGIIRACQSLGQDITREKKLEEDLRQAQKMESIGRLAGGISHDFNNLLSPILGYADMLIINLAKDDPQHEFLTQIQKAADRAKTLTRQLLAFSRKQVLDMKSVCPDEIVSGFEKILRRTIREDIAVTINLKCPDNQILADISQIEQILMNLAVNAQDAMPEGGRLTIETAMEFTEIGGLEPLTDAVSIHCVRLSVRDTGAGMDAYTLAHAFDPFFTTKGKDKGTGLGLSTVHGIVRQHGGIIRIVSETGKGTAFNLFFPVTETNGDAVLEIPEDSADLEGHETVLVVEDNDMVRDVVCQILERYGYRVIETGSPNAVSQIIEDHDGHFDLLLTDVIMPEMNGKQLYEKVKSLLPDIRVLFMSGYADNVLVRHELTGKKWPFIQKPVGVRELAVKVRETLNHEKDDGKPHQQ